MDWVALIVAVAALVVSTIALLRGRSRPVHAVPDAAPASPWKLTIAGSRFTFTNVSHDRLSAVSLAQTNGNTLTALQQLPVASLAPGAAIVLDAKWTSSSPSTAKVVLTWHVGGGPMQELRETLV